MAEYYFELQTIGWIANLLFNLRLNCLACYFFEILDLKYSYFHFLGISDFLRYLVADHCDQYLNCFLKKEKIEAFLYYVLIETQNLTNFALPNFQILFQIRSYLEQESSWLYLHLRKSAKIAMVDLQLVSLELYYSDFWEEY